MALYHKPCRPLLFFCLLLLGVACFGQQQPDRFVVLEQRLRDLAQNVPSLNQKVETSVSNGSLQEFLQGLASAHNLNFNVDPALTQKITSYFSNETVINILLYLAKQYNLTFIFTGSIISIVPYIDPLANQPPPPKQLSIQFDSSAQVITMDLQDDTLLNVARKITRLSNKNIVVLPEIFYKKVTGYIQGLPVQNALEKLALTNAFKLNKTNDDVFVLEPLRADEEIVTRQNTPKNANYSIRKVSKSNNVSSSSSIQVGEDSVGNKLINLNVTNVPIKEVIKSISEQAGINYFVYSEIIGTTTASVQNMPFDKVLNYILQGTNYTYNTENGVYMIGERKDEGLRANRLVQLKYRSVDSLIAVIPEELKKGVEIKEFKELNSFLLSGSHPQIKEIEAFVKQVDQTVPMVMIEVIIMDVQKNRTISTGLKIGIGDSATKSGGSLLGGPGLDYTFGANNINKFIGNLGLNNVFNIGKVSPNFYVSLKALESRNNIDLRQTPKLSTLNGHTANLSIGNTQYYSVSTQNVVGSLNPNTIVTQQYIPVEADLSINIRPFVSGDNQVTLNISVNISDFTGTPAPNAPPPVSSSKFSSIIRVKNEEMVVLGGIERNEKSESSSGIPILSRIPVLKWLFSSRDKTDNKTVSVVFIKPTIIY